jgi:hypothetical protein
LVRKVPNKKSVRLRLRWKCDENDRSIQISKHHTIMLRYILIKCGGKPEIKWFLSSSHITLNKWILWLRRTNQKRTKARSQSWRIPSLRSRNQKLILLFK